MKAKFNIDAIKSLSSHLVGASILLVGIYGSVGYYSYERQTEISSENINNDSIYTNEDGELCCKFDIGQHKISISRNDSLNYKIEKVEGYEIEEVEVTGWRDNNKVIYVNKKPVVVKATRVKDGKVEFAGFGEVIKDKVKAKAKK